ncbi:10519_t:CDS:2 [Acaulospora colombiana]|uniref:10519_t:CDS:1 n=1 Tax=Acaulospora colombiana TaxID=27376 RepID=A0ACA9KGU8_9GLOM|nr:10519_t:CDS:2 [Acaulospora colombiana]
MALTEKDESNVRWLLNSFNPEPLEFYRYMNRKTKHIVTSAYHCALSVILSAKNVNEEKIKVFKNIQQKWKDGDFKNDWNKYIAERSASESVKASHSVQRSYNCEVASYSLKRQHSGPSTPNKPATKPKLKQLYPQVSFTKRVKIAREELQNKKSESEDLVKRQDNHNNQNLEESESKAQLS